MREQIVEFLNQHPSVLGVIFAVTGGWELWQAVLRYEAYKKDIARWIRKRSWLVFIGLKPAQPRPISISAALLIFIMGLAMIDFEIALLPKMFWGVLAALALFNLLTVLLIVKWKAWKKG